MQNPVLQARLMAYLTSWYETSTQNQRNASVEVTLTLKDFLSLVKPHVKLKLTRSLNAGTIHRDQASDNKNAYVLTWASYAARSTNVMDKTTAVVVTRQMSELLCLPKKGDKLRPGHRAKISKSNTGKTNTPEHNQNISAGKKGKKIAGWSPERHAKHAAKHGKAI